MSGTLRLRCGPNFERVSEAVRNKDRDGQPWRVAHVSLGLEMGGMERLLVEFARHADRQRFQLHFICLKSRGANEHEPCRSL